MKKWGFLLLITLLLVVGSRYVEPYAQQEIELVNSKQIASKDSMIRNVTPEQIYQGDLLLVNKDYPVRQECVKSDIVNLYEQKDIVKSYGLLDTNIRLSKSVAEQFQKMIEDAEKEQVNHFMINSGYRDFKEQEELYQAKGSDYALPAGYSEHNLGLSLDVGSTQAKMSVAPEGKWLEDNAWKYGFILRYPEDKTDITGIQYEPWHFRYVGLPHSAIMQEHNFTLEEYLDYLKDIRDLLTVVNGKRYEITYHQISENTIITLPANQTYEISGNNIDGVIVTVEGVE